MEHFKKLNAIDVNSKTEKKAKLTYLSWAWAWAETKKVYPDAMYKIHKFNNLPYVFDEKTGYMVFTEVTIEGQTYEMWLPVMDGNNNSMKSQKYSYFVKEYDYGKPTGKMIEKFVEPANMFDINKTIMRCLTKNLAMFGLGLYIYAGEDMPEDDEPPKTEPKTETSKTKTETIADLINKMANKIQSMGYDVKESAKKLNITTDNPNRKERIIELLADDSLITNLLTEKEVKF